jgi:hypothetical protein
VPENHGHNWDRSPTTVKIANIAVAHDAIHKYDGSSPITITAITPDSAIARTIARACSR